MSTDDDRWKLYFNPAKPGASPWDQPPVENPVEAIGRLAEEIKVSVARPRQVDTIILGRSLLHRNFPEFAKRAKIPEPPGLCAISTAQWGELIMEAADRLRAQGMSSDEIVGLADRATLGIW